MIILFCAFFNRKRPDFCEIFKKRKNLLILSPKIGVDFWYICLFHNAQFIFANFPEFTKFQAFIELQAAYREAF